MNNAWIHAKGGRTIRQRLSCSILCLILCLLPAALALTCPLLPAFAAANPAPLPAPLNVQDVHDGHCPREILDSVLGLRWRMVTDPLHRSRPARLVLVSSEATDASAGWPGCPVRNELRLLPGKSAVPAPAHLATGIAPAKPVIQPGDHIVLVQQGSALAARLPAVALSAAAPGERVSVRLRIGNGGFGSSSGRVIAAVALEHGLARWADRNLGGGTGAAW